MSLLKWVAMVACFIRMENPSLFQHCGLTRSILSVRVIVLPEHSLII